MVERAGALEGVVVIELSWWKNQRVAVTGHTGFIGTWLCFYLRELQAEVHGFGLAPQTSPSLFDEAKTERQLASHVIADIRDAGAVSMFIDKVQPTVVIHLAAQPIVLQSYREPQYTWETNVLGTIHILEAIRNCPTVRTACVFTSDKCYENREKGRPFGERDPLGGKDPYSSSKAAAELAVSAWRHSFFKSSPVSLSTIRSGNILGGGDWSEDRIIPDCIRALQKSETITLRSPQAIRPWQHVLDAISALLLVIQAQAKEPQRFSESFNVGPITAEPVTVAQVVEQAHLAWNNQNVVPNIVPSTGGSEAVHLQLDVTKIQSILSWRPLRTTQQCIQETVVWYRTRHEQGAMFDAAAACRSAIAADLAHHYSRSQI